MRALGEKGGLLVAVLLGGLSVLPVGCGDDAEGSSASLSGNDGGTTLGGDDGADASVDSSPATGTDASGLPTLPELLSLSGCEDLGVPALCSVTQTGGSFSANCGGLKYTGTVTADRAVELSSPETTDRNGAKSSIACRGKLQSGVLALDCQRTTTAAASADAGVPGASTCKLVSDREILPGVACMELPAELTGVSVCKEGAAQGGTTIAGGTCKVRQDGCAFQAECESDVTLTGSVTRTGVRFSQRLKALADAATPTTGMPAFAKGADVDHTCTGTIEGGKLTGSCTAGAVRGSMPTSVCAIEGAGTQPPTCGLIGPAAEQLFVLNSCDLLKSGEGANPGIGEPVCAFRQNGCIWDVQCGNSPLTKFSGRLTPGATKLEWRLPTGTPCELSIGASGAVSGSCTVPGQTPCQLSSMPASPGTASCPVLPGGTNVKSHGCGGGDPLTCRATLQHQCNYMAICQFTANNPDLLIAGKTSVEAGRPRFEFNGLGAYQCSVTKATDAEIASGDRSPYEWYGQCQTPAGGMCRDNYDPVAKTGFRGLRLYFDVPAGVTVPPAAAAVPAAAPTAP